MPEFYSQVYQPEEDTFLLLKCALKEAKPIDSILEIGTGSGFIAKAMNEISAKTIAVDINPHACRAAKNYGVEVIRSDLMSCLSKKFDLVLFNPPYLPTAPEERINDWLEYALDGGQNGRFTIERFIDMLGSVMSKSGRCLLLISSLTGTDEVSAYLSKTGFISYIIAEEQVEDEKLFVMRIIFDMCRL